MSRTRSTVPTRSPRPVAPRPLPADWLLLTDADRAIASLADALSRTSRWQGDAT